MAVYSDFSLMRFENGILSVAMTPPTAIGGWNIQFIQTFRPGGEPFIIKSMSSGYYGVSGMTIINSGQGIMAISLLPIEMSGHDPGAYAWRVTRQDSGYVTDIAQGHRLAPY